jgi:hypothetical protein
MKTLHILLLALVVIAALYMLGVFGRSKDSYRRTSLAPNAGPCDYLAEDFPKASSACSAYQKICGLGSTASEVLNLEESSDGAGDPRVLQWLASDLATVTKDPSQCASALKCPDGQSDCPSAFPSLKCTNGACL